MSDPPVLLALDTSSDVGSVAVGRGKGLLGRGWLLQKGEHGARLVPEIEATLARAGVERTEIDGVVVGRGPGSFTGLRIAAATAKGLSKALGVPLWDHSSLSAAAASGKAEVPESVARARRERVDHQDDAGVPRYVLFDARSDRVYRACYRILADRLVTLIEPSASTIAEVLGSRVPEDSVFCGNGALRHEASLTEAGYLVRDFPTGLPTAEGLLRVHWLLPGAAPTTERRWEPEYLRGSSAVKPARSRESRA